MSQASRCVLIKLGGSLITDKTGTEVVRRSILRRLAGEIAAAACEGVRLVVGHGSGSFGHAAATSGAWLRGAKAPDAETAARTQDAAARLHREVISALLEAGAPGYSLAPGSMMTCPGGRVVLGSIAPLVAALEAGLVPVTFGDVVLDPGDASEDGEVAGARIVSTEAVFLALAPELRARGHAVDAALWLGITPGILDASGRPFESVGRAEAAAVLKGLKRGDAGEGVRDVTGGMRHRLETALSLADLGVRSVIADGREEGVIAAAFEGSIEGTTVLPDR